MADPIPNGARDGAAARTPPRNRRGAGVPRATARTLLIAAATAGAIGTATARAAEEPASYDCRWALDAHDAVVYRVSKVKDDGRFEKDFDRLYSVYGHELDPKTRRYAPPVTRLDELPFVLTLELPAGPLKKGTPVRAARDFDELTEYAPLRAEGTWQARGVVERQGREQWQLAGDFTLRPAPPRAGADPEFEVVAGSVRLDVLFNPRERIAHTVTWQFRASRRRLRPSGSEAKGAQSVVERRDTLVRMRKYRHRWDGFQKEVDAAVQQGLAALRKRQRADGSWEAVGGYPVGPTALALLTLLKSGVPKSDPAIVKGFTWLVQQPFRRTYEVGLSIMALEAWYTPESEAELIEKGEIRHPRQLRRLIPDDDRRWLQDAADWLVETMASPGLWGYGAEPEPNRTPARTRSGRAIPPAVTGEGAPPPAPWTPARDGHVPQKARTGSGDHSNTQYAILGLDAAARCRIDVPPAVWLDVVKYFESRQEPRGEALMVPLPPGRAGSSSDGPAGVRPPAEGGPAGRPHAPPARRSQTAAQARGWGYHAPTRVSTSMTCAGLTAESLARANLEYRELLAPPLEQRTRRAIDDGCAWLYRHWTVKENFAGEERWYLYALYGLERAAVLDGRTWLGDRDWYWEGALQVLGRQRDDGLWHLGSSSDALENTCFALLFLKRATVPVISGGR